ncbi:MAG: MFS transporter [SAR86 cluster bacterium]|uniref:MFS transporter n=1 Tax=SAR86 cluster bacterium TaxID=2030880 RepID=A0A937JD10_9GAMM|nr:MFS transporter [SAR86 cluster bacterium]MDC0872974.1 MFS transporter [Gammaproteobacteria bacterium]|tara:strand:+ start:5961 stop:7388 length:1428 start_codon:yes stop_codon:yes gene_type:complete
MSSIKLTTKFSYGVGAIGEASVLWLLATLAFFFYNQVIGLSGFLTGLAVSIAIFFDAISDPLVGSMSDNFKSRLGRRHPFMFASPLPVMICVFLIFTPPEGMNQLAIFAWFTGFTILLKLSITLFTIPHLALGAELSDDYIERSKIMSFNNVLSYTGVIIMHVYVWFFIFPNIEGYELGQLSRDAYPPIVIFSCILVGIALTSSAYFTKDQIPKLKQPKERRSKNNLFRFFKDIGKVLKNKNYLYLLLGIFFLSILIGTHEVLGLYMYTFYWKLSPIQTGWLILNNVFGYAIGFIVTARLHVIFEKPIIIVLSAITLSFFWSLAVILSLFGLAPEPASWDLVIFIIILGSVAAAAGSILHISVMSALADVCDEHELLTGYRQEGIFYSARSFFAKASGALGSIVAGTALEIINFPSYGSDKEITQSMLFNLGILDGPFAMIWGLIAAFFYSGYKITNKYHREIRDKLEQKKLYNS